MKHRRGGILAFIILFIIGVIFFILGTFVGKLDAELKDRCSYRTTAIVVDFIDKESDDSMTYTPVFRYEYNGNTYESNMSSYSSGMRSKFELNGKSYDIGLNPSDPYEIYSEEVAGSTDIIVKVFKYIGIGLITISVIALVITLIKIVIYGGLLGIAVVESNKFNQQQQQYMNNQNINQYKPKNGLDGLGNVNDINQN